MAARTARAAAHPADPEAAKILQDLQQGRTARAASELVARKYSRADESICARIAAVPDAVGSLCAALSKPSTVEAAVKATAYICMSTTARASLLAGDPEGRLIAALHGALRAGGTSATSAALAAGRLISGSKLVGEVCPVPDDLVEDLIGLAVAEATPEKLLDGVFLALASIAERGEQLARRIRQAPRLLDTLAAALQTRSSDGAVLLVENLSATNDSTNEEQARSIGDTPGMLSGLLHATCGPVALASIAAVVLSRLAHFEDYAQRIAAIEGVLPMLAAALPRVPCGCDVAQLLVSLAGVGGLSQAITETTGMPEALATALRNGRTLWPAATLALFLSQRAECARVLARTPAVVSALVSAVRAGGGSAVGERASHAIGNLAAHVDLALQLADHPGLLEALVAQLNAHPKQSAAAAAISNIACNCMAACKPAPLRRVANMRGSLAALTAAMREGGRAAAWAYQAVEAIASGDMAAARRMGGDADLLRMLVAAVPGAGRGGRPGDRALKALAYISAGHRCGDAIADTPGALPALARALIESPDVAPAAAQALMALGNVGLQGGAAPVAVAVRAVALELAGGDLAAARALVRAKLAAMRLQPLSHFLIILGVDKWEVPQDAAADCGGAAEDQAPRTAGGGQRRPRAEPRAQRRCGGCGTAGVPLRACSGCRREAYCGAGWQQAAWPGHKAACKAAQAEAKAAGQTPAAP